MQFLDLPFRCHLSSRLDLFTSHLTSSHFISSQFHLIQPLFMSPHISHLFSSNLISSSTVFTSSHLMSFHVVSPLLSPSQLFAVDLNCFHVSYVISACPIFSHVISPHLTFVNLFHSASRQLISWGIAFSLQCFSFLFASHFTFLVSHQSSFSPHGTPQQLFSGSTIAEPHG